MAKDTIIHWTFIYGNTGPSQLYDFANWLRALLEKQQFSPIDTVVDFGNLKYIVLPKPPPPKAGVKR